MVDSRSFPPRDLEDILRMSWLTETVGMDSNTVDGSILLLEEKKSGFRIRQMNSLIR